MNLSYSPNSPQVRLARFRKHYGTVSQAILYLIVATGLGGAYSLKDADNHFGIALGISLIALTGLVFIRLAKLHPDPTDNELRLEVLLDDDLLPSYTKDINANGLWKLAASTWQGAFIISRLGLSTTVLGETILIDTISSSSALAAANDLRQKYGRNRIDGGILAVALLQSSALAKTILPKYRVKLSDVETTLGWLVAMEEQNARKKPHYGGFGRDWAVGYTPMLDRFGTNLSRQAESARGGLRYPGQNKTIDALVTQLSRSNSSAVIVGEVGIGKTSLLYGVADELLQGRGGRMAHHQIVSLNASVLLAQASHDDNLENLLLHLFSEAVLAGNIIIALDEAQLFFGHGTGAINLSQLLLPIIQSGRLPILLTITPSDWIQIKATNSALTSLLTPLLLQEATKEESIQVIGLRALQLDHQHGTITLYSALESAYELSGRFIQNEAYPGKAIKLLEGAYAKAGGLLLIEKSTIEAVVEAEFGVKVSVASGAESNTLLNLEAGLQKRMIGQTAAVKAVSAALRRSRAGITSSKRPMGSFLFLGPTGVGKTELAKSLAAACFEAEDRMIRLDMSEYSQSADVSRILSDTSPDGLLSKIRQTPYAVVLFDEIEKADQSIINLLLQLLDEGKLTDTSGKAASFKECIIIATSNAGAEAIKALPADTIGTKKAQSLLLDKLIEQKSFKPELLNRFDEVVLFAPLSENDVLQIVDLLVADLNTTLSGQELTVTVTPEAKLALVKAGYDPRFGARPMRRIIQSSIQDSLAKRVLAGTATPGTTVNFDVTDLELSQ
ncbi:MAG: AAA family ATPase [Candidatus Saccharibacteria bacterium]